MLVVLSLLGLYFFVAMVELCLMASKQVNEIKAAANFGSGGDDDASKGLIETKAEEAEKAKGFMDMVEDLNKKLELSVHEVPMIAVLVFFAHVRVRVSERRSRHFLQRLQLLWRVSANWTVLCF